MTGPKTGGDKGYLRIATEEAFATAEMLQSFEHVFDGADPDPGFLSLMGFYMRHKSERATWVFERLKDLGELRIADMDERGIDIQVIGLTSPGPNILAADVATGVARDANDQLAEACRAHPDRFVGMAAFAAQAPGEAAKEIERAVSKLDMRAAIINSHIQGEYLDAPKFYPVLEAIEAMNVPLYLHPNTPPRAMIGPMLEAGLDGAIFGFGVETGMHALRLITSGVFDRFPKLQVIIGHMGEALPYWMYRLDFMHQAAVKSARYESMKSLKKGTVSNYLREHFFITNSGMAWEPAVKFAQDVVGKDRVLYAMDYPYQCPVEEVIAMDAMEIDMETKRMFFQENAQRLFKIKL